MHGLKPIAKATHPQNKNGRLLQKVCTRDFKRSFIACPHESPSESRSLEFRESRYREHSLALRSHVRADHWRHNRNILPALHGGVLMDDDLLLTNNSLVKAPDGLSRIWYTTQSFDYWPLTNSSFWLEWRLWGKNPTNLTGYHVTNLALHLAAVFLLWAILHKLAVPGAYLAALLFAVHPVNVQSVAWIAQRKNTLAMVFLLISIICYLKGDRTASPSDDQKRDPAGTAIWYWLSLLAFVLAMFSKGSVAILPVLLVIIDWWRGVRFSAGRLARLAPFFAIAVALTWLNIWFQTHGKPSDIRQADFFERLCGAAPVFGFIYPRRSCRSNNILFIRSGILSSATCAGGHRLSGRPPLLRCSYGGSLPAPPAPC